MNSFLHLRTFVEVASTGSFAATARAMGLPRSTVTARIKALEDQLGAALFQRTTRSVRLTSEGETYLSRVRPALEEVAAATEDFSVDRPPKGPIRISIPVDIPAANMAEILSNFQRLYPEIVFDIDVSDRPVDLVREGFDLALRGKRVTSPGLVIRKISENQIILAVRSEIASSFVGKTLGEIQKVLDPIGLTSSRGGVDLPMPPIACRNLELTKAYILRDDWAGLLPRKMCLSELTDGRLTEVDVDGLPEPLPLFAVLPTARLVPRRVRIFVDYLAEMIG